MSSRRGLPLIAIVGPTASGKTAAAIEVAKRVSGEIICADSRTIYRGMDIGTAKPDTTERAEVSHWGLDLVDPDQTFSVAQFQAYAKQKIDEIRARGRVPILVGGSGLYIDAVVFDYGFMAQPTAARDDARLEKLTNQQLLDYCIDNNIELPKDYHNRRRLMRAIQRGGRSTTTDRHTLVDNVIVVGIATKRDVLHARIAARAELLFTNGMLDEARQLATMYGWQHESMTGNIYSLAREYIAGNLDREQLLQQFIQADSRLAKRQMTWFRRNPMIEWCDLSQVVDYTVRAIDAHNVVQ